MCRSTQCKVWTDVHMWSENPGHMGMAGVSRHSVSPWWHGVTNLFSRFHSLALSVNIPLSGAKQSQWLHITWLDLTVVHYGILYSGANGGISLTTKMAAANGSHVPLLRLVVSLSNCVQRRFGLRLLIMPLATDNEMRGSSPARICKLGLLSVIKSWIRVLWRTQSCVRIL